MERYKIIGQASCQVYEALGRACTKHTEHQAHFCVEVEQAKIIGDRSAQIKFSMAYTHMTLAGSVDQSDLIWFAVDSTSGDAMEHGNSGTKIEHFDSFARSLKQQIAPPQGHTKKCVRFQSAGLASACASSTSSTITMTNAILSNDNMRKDFCDFLRKRLREPLQENECVGVLDMTDNCRSFVYPSSKDYCRQRRQAVSLGQIISNVSKRQAAGEISLYERFRLARILAITVLQYHSTPWLRVSWRSEDIYFFGNGITSTQNIPSLISPYMNVRVKGPCTQLSCTSAFSPPNMIRNQLLYSLGIVLLEIAYTSTMETLQCLNTLESGPEDRYTEFFAAQRLARSAKSGMGNKYHRIVEKVVECDFGCGTDLKDPQLQAAFHRDVICPLERLEQDMQNLHFN